MKTSSQRVAGVSMVVLALSACGKPPTPVNTPVSNVKSVLAASTDDYDRLFQENTDLKKEVAKLEADQNLCRSIDILKVTEERLRAVPAVPKTATGEIKAWGDELIYICQSCFKSIETAIALNNSSLSEISSGQAGQLLQHSQAVELLFAADTLTNSQSSDYQAGFNWGLKVATSAVKLLNDDRKLWGGHFPLDEEFDQNPSIQGQGTTGWSKVGDEVH